ncbi:MAG: M10 family metallopeptidase C-terminal domain-containing protein, partial [Hyphomicrobiaceae bacterium]
MPSSSNVPASGNQDIDGLLSGLKWDTNSLTYSFPDTASFYGYPGERDDNFEALNSTQIAAVQQILTLYTSVANLSFSMITETETVHADLRFAMSDEPSTAWAYYPSAGEWGGDSWYNNTSGDYDNPLRGTYAYHTFLHEIGHALGLKHGHETDTYGALPANHDSQEYSVMTYRSYVGSPGSYYSVYEGEGVQTLMMNDIAALQYMHGANFTTNSSNTIYTWSSTTGEMFINSVGQGANTENTIFATIWDGGGIDTYDLSNYSGGVSIDLRPGEWTTVSSAQLSTLGYDDGLGGEVYARGNIANALLYQGNVASLIENAFGGDGADTITGNQAANLLLGNGGADTIDGREGNDLIYAGEGIDTVHGGDNDDRIDGAGGNDTLHGDAGADLITGGAGDDTIYGGADTDTFLLGEAGMDTIHGDDGDDRIDGGADNDTLYGDAGADRITGGLGDDTIYGGEGDDQFLLGEGGSDTIYGGLGVDFL